MRPNEPGLAERVSEVSRLLRSPMAANFGAMSQDGRDGLAALSRLFAHLPKSRTDTPADALALVSLAGEVFGHVLPFIERNELTDEGVGMLSFLLIQLRAYLAEQAGLEPNAFGLSKQEHERR